jgi:hypothetical protein
MTHSSPNPDKPELTIEFNVAITVGAAHPTFLRCFEGSVRWAVPTDFMKMAFESIQFHTSAARERASSLIGKET